jgi:hypothetical protein
MGTDDDDLERHYSACAVVSGTGPEYQGKFHPSSSAAALWFDLIVNRGPRFASQSVSYSPSCGPQALSGFSWMLVAAQGMLRSDEYGTGVIRRLINAESHT